MSHRCARVPAAILAALSLSSCETISRAPVGTPRLELEVVVNVDPSYTGKLENAGPDLTRAVAELVLGQADLGLRFYPTLSAQYGAEDARPEYLLTVDVRDLDVLVDHRTVRAEAVEPVTTAIVKQIDCMVSATLTKRRPAGPPLIVGRADGRGQTLVDQENRAEPQVAYTVKRPAGDPQSVTLRSEDLLRSTERGLSKALTPLVAPVDRELAMRTSTAATSGGTPAAPQ